MVRLYRGHRIEAVRLDNCIHYHVERLRDGEPVSEGEYTSAWGVREVITDLKAALDIRLGTLDD